MKHAMAKLLEDIPVVSKDNPEKQLYAALMILSKIGDIEYDREAVSARGEKDNRLIKNCRNLYGGLVNGKAVCGGKALILKEAFIDRGMDAKIISGFFRSKRINRKIKKYLGVKKGVDEYTAPEQISDEIKSRIRFLRKKREKYYKINEGAHAWNQICIGGYWINCDPTNFDSVYQALLNDKDFNSNPKLRYYRRERSYNDKPSACELSLQEIIERCGIVIEQESLRKKIMERPKEKRLISLKAIKEQIILMRRGKSSRADTSILSGNPIIEN